MTRCECPSEGYRRWEIVLAAVVMFEGIGPLLTRRALLTGEAQTIPAPLRAVADADLPMERSRRSSHRPAPKYSTSGIGRILDAPYSGSMVRRKPCPTFEVKKR